jgi:Fe-S-cluster containining protein
MNGKSLSFWHTDIWLIAPMVTYLGYNRDYPPTVNPRDEELLGQPLPEQHWYSCKHFDPDTCLCTIYEIRPSMCRSYPGRGSCNYGECTWTDRKEKKQTPEEIQARLKRLEGEKGVMEVDDYVKDKA